MSKVMGGRRSTYLLLSGIKVSRAVRLTADLELLPIAEKGSPRPFLSNLEMLDQQFALLLLPFVDSQLKVSGQGGEDISTRAWNALWDVLLLSAIYATTVNCGLQSSSDFDRFTQRSRLNIIHYRLYDPPRGDGLALAEADCLWLEQFFPLAQDLLAEHRFQNAVHCLATYHWHSLPRAQLALLWAGIEGLFAVDSEIAFRISLYSAKFLAPTDAVEQRRIFEGVRRLYGVRSKAVHGGKIKGEPSESVDDSVKLLGRLIRACIEGHRLPVVSELAL